MKLTTSALALVFLCSVGAFGQDMSGHHHGTPAADPDPMVHQEWAKQRLAKSPRHQEWVKVKNGTREVLLRQHFPEIINRPRIARFTERAYRLLSHELIRVSSGDLDQDRHRLFATPFGDRSNSLDLHLRMYIRALCRLTQKLEAALANTLAEKTNSLAAHIHRIVTLCYFKQLVFNARTLDL